MSERPYVICHMVASIDGGLHPSRYTASPDGTVKDWSKVTEAIHSSLGGQAWIVGRATMAEMAKGEPHPPAGHRPVDRSRHIARRDAGQYAIAVDTTGKLHFRGAEVAGDHLVVLLGGEVPDQHLAELVRDGVSYIVSEGAAIDLAQALVRLRSELGIDRLLLEGGAEINGSFLAAGLVDELSLVVAPALDGRVDQQNIVTLGHDGLAGKLRLSLRDCTRLDHGAVHLRYAVLPAQRS